MRSAFCRVVAEIERFAKHFVMGKAIRVTREMQYDKSKYRPVSSFSISLIGRLHLRIANCKTNYANF